MLIGTDWCNPRVSKIGVWGCSPKPPSRWAIFEQKIAILAPFGSNFVPFWSYVKEPNSKIKKPVEELNCPSPSTSLPFHSQVKSKTCLNAWYFRLNFLGDMAKGGLELTCYSLVATQLWILGTTQNQSYWEICSCFDANMRSKRGSNRVSEIRKPASALN